MSQSAYESYKDSHVEWLGKIPSGWSIMRLRASAEVLSSNVDKKSIEGEIPVRLCNYTDVYYNERITSDLDFMEASATEAEIRRFTLKSGDVVITKDSETAEDIGVPTFIAEDIEHLVCGYHLAILRGDEARLVGRYLFYLINSKLSSSQFAVAANGVTRFGLSYEALKNVISIIPPLSEQELIANFLDDKTTQIDLLIEKKEKLLKLLTVKRTALITQAVTKGLDPAASMKTSGIEWLGAVPNGWTVMALRYLANPIIGLTYSPENVVDENEGSLVLRASNIQKGKLSVKKQKNVYVDAKISKKLRLQENDILVCSRNGSRKLIGKNALIKKPEKHWTFGAFTTVLRGRQNEFLYWVLNSSLFEFQSSRFLTSTINQLTTGTFKSLEIPVPPEAEQSEICAFLKEQTTQLDRLEQKLTEAVSKLREYRSAIITNAVTGKIKVS